MTTSTERLLTDGFNEWNFVEQAIAEIKSYVDEDPQLLSDVNAILKRARNGELDRARVAKADRPWKGNDGGASTSNGDWRAPMASGNLLGEIRFNISDFDWVLRLYVAACNRSPLVMVALLFADKLRNGDDEASVRKTQQEDIDKALGRMVTRDRA